MDDPAARSPPPTPPRVVFDPPLFFQRRTAVVDILTLLHKHPRFNGKLKSLIDIGCGTECLLLQNLISPNDDLPLEQVTGIDTDPMMWDRDVAEALKPEIVTEEGERWRKLGLTLLCGSFESLSLRNIAHHDIVTSCEVIEHLDPGPLSSFAQVLLGDLKPKICIITTPNREFNDIFTLPFTPISGTPAVVESETEAPALHSNGKPPIPPTADGRKMVTVPDHCTSDSRYWREGVPYGMRHPDHKFEWTRREFRDWAKDSAETYGYTVSFTGVGGFRNGMCVINSSGAAVRTALKGGVGLQNTCYGTGGLAEEVLNKAFAQADEDIMEKASNMWGDCTQIAIFILKEESEESQEEFVKFYDWSKYPASNPAAFGPSPPSFSICPLNPWVFPNPIGLVCHHNYPYVKEEVFPPKFLTLMEMLEPELLNFLPGRMLEEWQKAPPQIMKDMQLRKQAAMTGKTFSELYCQYIGGESDSECDYGWDPEIDGDEAVRRGRKRERKMEKRKKKEMEEQVLGGKRADLIRVVKVMGVPLKALWKSSNWKLKRACRHRFEVFKEVLMNVVDEVNAKGGNHSRTNSVSEQGNGNSNARCYCGKARYYKVVVNTTGIPLRDEDDDGYSSPYGVCASCQRSKSGTPSPAVARRRTSISSGDSQPEAPSPASTRSASLTPGFPWSPASPGSGEYTEPSTSGCAEAFVGTSSDAEERKASVKQIPAISSVFPSVPFPEESKQDKPTVLHRSQSATISADLEVSSSTKRSAFERSKSNSSVLTALNNTDEAPERSGLVRFAGMAEVWQDNRLVTAQTSRAEPRSILPISLNFNEVFPKEEKHEFSRPFSPSKPQQHGANCESDAEPLTPESSVDMFVKLYSVAATRSVIDLIRTGLTETDKQVLRRWKVVRIEMNPFVGEDELLQELSEVDKEFRDASCVENEAAEDISEWSEAPGSSTGAVCASNDVSPLTPLDGAGWNYFELPASAGTRAQKENIGSSWDKEDFANGAQSGSWEPEPFASWEVTNPTGDETENVLHQATDHSQCFDCNDNIEEKDGESSKNDNGDASSESSQHSQELDANEYSNHRMLTFSYYSSYDDPNDLYDSLFIPKKYRMELIYGLENVHSRLSVDEPLASWQEKGKWRYASTGIEKSSTLKGRTNDNPQMQTNKDVSRFMVLFSCSGIGLGPSITCSPVSSALGQAGITSPRIITVSWPAYQLALQRVSRWIEKRREMQREGNLYLAKKILVQKIEWDEWCEKMEQEEADNRKEKFKELSRRKFKLRIEGEKEHVLWKEEAMEAAGWNGNGEETEIGVVVYKPKERWAWEGPDDEPETTENGKQKEKEKALEDVKVWWITDSTSSGAQSENQMEAENTKQKQRRESASGPVNQRSRNNSVCAVNGGVAGVGTGITMGSSLPNYGFLTSPSAGKGQKLFNRVFETGDENVIEDEE